MYMYNNSLVNNYDTKKIIKKITARTGKPLYTLIFPTSFLVNIALSGMCRRVSSLS